MESNKLRKLYFDYFLLKKHKIEPSASMIVKNDSTLMFTNAGMNQFKDVFLGDLEPKDLRIANSQKCLRVSGKHNDLEQVGHDTYHHTMFEMLGSWSFGDYFKKEAIDWAWKFLTEICDLDKERFYVTVFEGSKEDSLKKDDESYNIWKDYLPEERILNGDKKDNFWEMGETGPCGPCSEIHYDNRLVSEMSAIKGKDLVNQDHPEVIEIWNLVFMQYSRFSDGSLKDLPNRHVDTGMGFERLAMIMQGVRSNYDTDIFQPIINRIEKKANISYGKDEKKDIAMRVVSDHIRAIAFSIADGQLPSNVKAGYVIRRILRRAVRYGYTFLGFKEPFMHDLVKILVNQFGSQFKELSLQKELISSVIKKEEEAFLRTLELGLKRINQIISISKQEISGKEVFELYDTYGFPSDLTAIILAEHELFFNQDEFDAEMQKQKERSRKAGKIKTSDWNTLLSEKDQVFVGHQKLESAVNIVRYREVIIREEKQYQLVFDLTPFYPQGGGQVGDRGVIFNNNETIDVLDCKKENKLIIHLVDTLPKDINTTFTAKVDINNRMKSSKNHTATHLLHETLRNILGEHVVQKGSLVDSKHLRFDFTHFSKIGKEDLRKIEDDVNAKILANIKLDEHTNIPLKEVENMGAMMLFGEKYEDVVRMIQFDTSKELCGGTHVNSTGEIGLFKILSEGSVSSGIRRIEAITGMSAIEYFNNQDRVVLELNNILKNKDLVKAVNQLIEKNKDLQKEVLLLKEIDVVDVKNEIINSEIQLNGIRFIAKEVDMSVDQMKKISFSLRKEINLFLVLGAKVGSKALLSVMITDDLLAKGLDASVIVKDIAKEINGGGGGQSFFATAGGTNIKGISNAFKRVENHIK